MEEPVYRIGYPLFQVARWESNRGNPDYAAFRSLILQRKGRILGLTSAVRKSVSVPLGEHKANKPSFLHAPLTLEAVSDKTHSVN